MKKGTYKRTEKHRKLMANIGIKNKNKPKSEETKRKIRETMKGQNKGRLSPWAGQSEGSKKTRFKKGHKINLGRTWAGKRKRWTKKNGIYETPLIKRIRHSEKYKQWRSDVFLRDWWTCQTCKKRGHADSEAHHIKEFIIILKENNIQTFEQSMNCKELWNIDNGVTLCHDCHKITIRRKINV